MHREILFRGTRNKRTAEEGKKQKIKIFSSRSFSFLQSLLFEIYGPSSLAQDGKSLEQMEE